MMGCFRELPGGLLTRLQNDPDLVEDIVLAQIPRSADVQAHAAAAVQQMKSAIAESGEQWLALLPQDQRDAIANLPPERKEGFFRRFAEQMAKLKGWDEIVARSASPSRLDAGELGRLLEIEKAWHGVHFLLTGSAADAPGPLGQAILGGTEIGQDGGYGPARYLVPEQVAAVATALREVTHDTLRNRYDPAGLTAANIYPGGWEDLENLDWLLESFNEVQGFYRDAAVHGSAVLL